MHGESIKSFYIYQYIKFHTDIFYNVTYTRRFRCKIELTSLNLRRH